jgi:glycerol-3-phosphate O-acyltransferase/dihydroxyacetone phosphate acyltransferase
VFCLVMVPLLWLVYGILMFTCTSLGNAEITLIMLIAPVFAYVGIIVTEAGMVDIQYLRPYFMRLIPSARKRLAKLPRTRKELQDDLRAFIKSIGERLLVSEDSTSAGKLLTAIASSILIMQVQLLVTCI